MRLTQGRIAALLLGAALLLLGSCADDPTGPDSGKALWIAQSVSGSVSSTTTHYGIGGVNVTFLAGLDDSTFVPLAAGVTTESGSFEFVRANQTGRAGDFWWFPAPSDKATKVYLVIRATRTGYTGVQVVRNVTRAPSSDAPTRALGSYQLSLDAALTPVSGGS